MTFSKRIGKTPEKKEIQIENMDLDLKIRLWNIILVYFLDEIDYNTRSSNNEFNNFVLLLYHNFYKLPVDTISDYRPNVIDKIKTHFFKCEWFIIYDLIEFILKFENDKSNIDLIEFKKIINSVLEEEFSAYRIINNQVVPITNEIEISQIENALKTTKQYASLIGANIHLNSALEKISDKKNPDFRNSIKESISAIESVSKVLSNNNKDSLGGALDKIKGKMNIHPSLERGFKQIYGYTSDGDGIRHALMDNPNCFFEDAMFMVVSSSSFINYLIIKAEKSGINII